MLSKRGQILIENITFIIFNILFFIVLILFLSRSILSSENVAKQLALFIDSAKKDDIIVIDFEKVVEFAEKNNVERDEIVKIEDNEVFVKLKEDGIGRYSFFNDVEVKTYFQENKLVMFLR